MKLTEKQKRFVDYYIETGNQTEAARRAGYKQPKTQGAENMTKPSVSAAIKKRLAEVESERIAKADEVLRFLTATLRGELTEEHIVVEGTGDGESRARIIEAHASVRDRIEAAKSLLKRYPMELDTKEQKLKLQKLEAEIRAATESDQATGKEPLVQIYLPDNGRGDNA